jgi:ADP-L-glycero-D-manno-heptose 6-epimerase
MRILVTGGAGFIGSSLALELQRRGEEVVAIDDLSSSNFRNLLGFKGDLIIEDITTFDPSSRFKKDGFDVIFHQAAITDTTFENDARMVQANVEGARKMLDFALEKGARFIYASSAGVYGNGPTPMKEDQRLSPLNAYAFSKSLIDNLAMGYSQRHRINIVGLRYFNVYGPGEEYKGRSASMIYQLAEQMKKGLRPRIFKYGEQFRDFIYIKDVVLANLSAMSASQSGVVNVGTGIPTTFNRIIELLNGVLSTSFEPEYFDNPYTSFYQNQTLADTQLVQNLMGFQAGYSVEMGIRDYIKPISSITPQTLLS